MSKPQRKFQDVIEMLKKLKVYDPSAVQLFAVRGYYRDSMGAKGRNDRGIYDDAVFVLAPDTFVSFNFNVDPSSYRKGSGYGSKKGMANLKPGTYKYQKGIHRGYAAFVQAGQVTVVRDGTPPYEDTGYFGINIHRGGNSGTSSLGCQTVPVAQWQSFKTLVYSLLDKNKQKTFLYTLVDESKTGWNS